MGFSRALFFSKNALEVFGFHNLEWCFALLKGEKMSYGLHNRARYMIFSDYMIRTPPKHPFSREK